jgi:hypothetical protein
MSKLNRPSKKGLEIMQSNLKDPTMEDFLLGVDKSIWSDPALKHDLVCVNEVHQPDPLTLWATKTFLGIFHKFVGRRYKSAVGSDGSPLFHYDKKHLEMPAEILSTALSALLPVAAIVVLYLVQNMAKRLAIIAVFTVMFSIGLVLMAAATRSENFAATAA